MPIVLRLGWRNLWRHPTRTALTASGIALGLAFLLVMLALGDGSHLQMIDATVRMGSGHVLLQAPGYAQRRAVELVVPGPTLKDVQGWAARQPAVRAVLVRAFASALLSSADGATGINLIGIAPAEEGPVSRWPSRVSSGRFLDAGDRNAAVIGSGVARLLKAGPGSRVVAMAQGARGGEVRSTLLHVVGVLHTGLEDLDQALVLIPLAALQEFLALDSGAHQIALLLDDQASSGAVARRVGQVFGGLEALTWAQADPQLEAAIRLDDGGHYLFNAIFFVIIGFMELNTLLMSVLERQRELTLLGALGVSPPRRLAMVLVEALLLAGLAIVAGLVIALGANFYLGTHGLPLAWFTEQTLETAGVVLEPIMYSSLSLSRVVSAAALVGVLTLALALVAGRHAAKPIDVNLLKP
jgi:ABC-type lipoprotein release transport system permease subunit